MKQKFISIITAFAMLMSLFGAMPITASAADVSASTIKLGDYVRMGKSGNGTLLWRCVAFEKATRQADGSITIDSTQTNPTYQAVGNNTGDTGYLPLMFADDAVGLRKQFDAAGDAAKVSSSHNRSSSRATYGSNYWGDSNIRAWLNSSAEAGKVYYPCGSDPLYKNEAGFLTNFSDTEKTAMQTATQKSLLTEADKDISGASGDKVHEYRSNIADVVQNYSTARSELITDTVFLLDVQQVYNVYRNDASLGGTGYYKGFDPSYPYWLRTPSCPTAHIVRAVYSDGSVASVSSVYYDGFYNRRYYDVRPAFFLNLSKAFENPFVGLDGSGTEDAPYTFGHKHVLKYHDKIDATCTSSGKGEYWQCEGCHNYFSDANGETEIFSPPRIPSKGHTWSEWTITKAPTETAKGEKVRECSVCHATETKEIAAFNDLNIGDYLEMGEYDGTKLLWRCVAFEKATRLADGSIEIDSTLTNPSYQAVGENAGDTGYLPLMLADAAIGKTKAFDDKGENTSGSHGRGSGRTTNGSNYWGDANIRDWLNSADKTVTYTCGNEPSRYKDETGFLTNFNSTEKSAMISVKQKALINSCDLYAVEDKTGSRDHTINSSITSVVANYSEAYATRITDTMFLLDVQQLYNVYSNDAVLGRNSYYKLSSEYWLRSPIYESNDNGRYVSSSPNAVYSAGVTGRKGVRPAFFFDLSAVEFEGGDGAKETPHTIPKPPHYHTLMHYEAVAPTCTESGTAEYWKCEGEEGCNKMFSDEDCTTEITEIPTINATGHSLTKTEAQDATCTAEGNREYWTCLGCGKLFSDANGTTETTLADTTIAAKGHTWGAWTVKTPATETTDGEKEHTCTVCNERETQVIPATGSEKFAIRYENGNAIVTAPKAGTYTVLFTAYDEGGILTGLAVQTKSLEKGVTTIEPKNFNASGTVKVMLWESLKSIKPLCNAAE